jgi:L-methionine (R)-S-oxide reductase
MFEPFLKTGDIVRDIPNLIRAQESLTDPDTIATLSNSASLLNWYLDDVNWVGFYLWNDESQELVLGPFQGLPACIRIKPGRGVCGTAFSSGRTQRVADVHQFPGHIACDADSRSELVIPLERDGRIIGVLDIDSPSHGRFSDAEEKALKLYVDALFDS